MAALALVGAVLAACEKAVAPRQDFPATDSTLSLLEPAGARCVWLKVDAVSRRRWPVAIFDGDCAGGAIALSADRKHGAVWFHAAAAAAAAAAEAAGATGAAGGSPQGGGDREAAAAGGATGGDARLFAVDVGKGADAGAANPAIAPPPVGTRDIGFDSHGRLIALTEQELTKDEIGKGEAIVDGKTIKLDPPAEGVPVLVHAFAFQDGAWARFETATSVEEKDSGVGVYQLKAAQDLAFRSSEVLSMRAEGDGEIDPALLARLARFAPQASPRVGEWVRFGSGNTGFELWENSSDLAYSTGLAAFLDAAGEPVSPPGWPNTEKDVVSYAWNGAYLLAARDRAGMHPRLYRGGKLVWSSDSARAVTFWPAPRR
jgi:hypothetical protein